MWPSIEVWPSSVGWLLVALGWWLLFAAVVGAIGAVKGRPGLGCALGLLLGPVGLVILLVMSGTLRDCPHCSALISRVAPVCSRCGRRLRG